MHEIDAAGPRRQRLARAEKGVRIAIEAEDAGRASFEQRPRVAPEAHGAIDEHSAGFGTEVLQHFTGHHGDVGH